MLLVQPAGCVVACFLQQYIGRKSGMLLMNVPQLIAWALMYAATSVRGLCVATAMMGVSAGFMEAPGLAYIGEISEPRIRGVLTSYANITVSVGMLLQYLMGSVFKWRTTVALSALLPLVAIVLIACVSLNNTYFQRFARRDATRRDVTSRPNLISSHLISRVRSRVSMIYASIRARVTRRFSNLFAFV